MNTTLSIQQKIELLKELEPYIQNLTNEINMLRMQYIDYRMDAQEESERTKKKKLRESAAENRAKAERLEIIKMHLEKLI